jgi:hypothetical protein
MDKIHVAYIASFINQPEIPFSRYVFVQLSVRTKLQPQVLNIICSTVTADYQFRNIAEPPYDVFPAEVRPGRRQSA